MTKQYLDMVKHVLENGEQRGDRTGTGTIGVFGYQTRYNLQEGFPLLTTKEMENLFPKIFHELMWFLKGETNIKYLVDRNVNIWNSDAYRWFKTKHGKEFPQMTFNHYIDLIKTDEKFAEKYGDLGSIYGKQWTRWEHSFDTGGFGCHRNIINQVTYLIKGIKSDPYGRRHIVSSWNVGELSEMALPPCHVMMQFYVSNDGKLSCQMYQRSADLFLGVPFNIASYALLTHMIARMCDLEVGEFIHTFGDLHIYNNHVEQMKEQLKREPLPLPKLYIKDKSYRTITDITDFELEDFRLVGYKGHPKLTGKVSVGE